MDAVEFVLPLKITSYLGLNSLYSTSKHWSTRKKEADYIHELVKLELVKNRVPRKFLNPPVSIDVFYNSKLDIDNHGYIAKLIIDGLKGYLIEDDNKKFVSGLYQDFWSGKGVKIRIKETSG